MVSIESLQCILVAQRWAEKNSRTMSIIHSHNNTFDSIFINNTGNTVQSCEYTYFISHEPRGDSKDC